MSVQVEIPGIVKTRKFLHIKWMDGHTKTTVILFFVTMMILMGAVEYLSGWILFNVS